tara:strand:+ start:1815 stop:2255 length:441 start_codon:yes stop_codon:yes gene_type:complete
MQNFQQDKIKTFSRWLSIIPNKFKDKFNNIYIANINNNIEFNLLKDLFISPKLVLNNLLFDIQFISKSSYIFDLILLFDVNNLNSDILIELKENILEKKGEIWILCDDIKINKTSKEKYIINMLNDTNIRSSTMKYSDSFSIIILK